jgi:hypothetical protein
MAVFIDSSSRTAKRGLKSERIDKLEFFPHHYTSSRFFLLLDLKVAKIEVKEFRIFVEK